MKKTATKAMSASASVRANNAGTINQSEWPTWVWAQRANIAPITGPTMKPIEKAIPTKA